MFCRLLCFPIAAVLGVVGGQVWIGFTDSSDSVVDIAERFLLEGSNATDAFVAAFLFGLLGGSGITILEVGNPIGTARSLLDSVGWFGGAVDCCFLGFVGILTRRARVTLVWIDDTVLTSSATFLCFIRFPTSNFFLDSFAWWFMSSSVVLPVGCFGRRLAYTCSSVSRSAFVPNFARSEFLIVTSLLPGSLITEVCSFVLITDDPGARTSYKPSRLFFDLFVRGLFLANFTSSDVSVLGIDWPTSGWEINLDSLFGSSFCLFIASLSSLSLFTSISMSLRSSLFQFSSVISWSHLTVSKSKYLFRMFL